MINNIIPVGLFWGTLLYYLCRKPQYSLNSSSNSRFLFSLTQIRRYLGSWKKLSAMSKNCNENPVGQNQLDQIQDKICNRFSLDSSTQKINPLQSSPHPKKKKLIKKSTKTNKNTARQYRGWFFTNPEPEQNPTHFPVNLNQKSKDQFGQMSKNCPQESSIMLDDADASEISSSCNKFEVPDEQNQYINQDAYNPFCQEDEQF